MKRETWDMILVMLVLVAVMLVMVDIYKQTKETGKCIRNPLTYGAKQMADVNNAEFNCYCSFNMANSPNIKFDSHNLTVTFHESGVSVSSINFSSLLNLTGG